VKKNDHMLIGFLIGVVSMQVGGLLLQAPYEPPPANGAEAVILARQQAEAAGLTQCVPQVLLP
jgi:hypothetical protein